MAITLNGSTGIVEANIADNAITSNKIVSDAITSAKIASGAVAASDLASGAARANFGAGGVLQVVQGTSTTPSTLNPGQTFTNLPNLSVSITPSSTSSKIMIVYHTHCGVNTENGEIMYRLARNSSAIHIGDSRDSNTRVTYGIGDAKAGIGYAWGALLFSGCYLDSPSTISSCTYTIQVATGFAQGGVIYHNQQAVNSSNAEQHTGASSIVVMEIAG